jgi:hypothetical protein
VALDPFVAKVCGKGVKLAQKMQVGPRIPAGLQLEKAEVGPTSRPTWRLSHCYTAGPRAPAAPYSPGGRPA